MTVFKKSRNVFFAAFIALLGLVLMGATLASAGDGDTDDPDGRGLVDTSQAESNTLVDTAEAVTNSDINYGGQLVQPEDAVGEEKYIVILSDPPVASYKGGITGLDPTSPSETGDERLDVSSEASIAYSSYLEGVQESFVNNVEVAIARNVDVERNLQHALNAVIMVLDPAEAAEVANLPGVVRVERNTYHEINTGFGPQWIGADTIWGGSSPTFAFTAELNGSNAVPTNTSTATGTADFTYDFLSGELTYKVITSGLGTVTAMHIHTGTAGTTGGVVVNLADAIGSTDTFTTALDSSQMSDFYDSLMNEGLYINVHTVAYPAGEIRGQLELDGTLGEGILVGVLDTGINLDHPSFAEVGPVDGYVHQNPLGSGTFVGWCDPGNPNYDPAYVCNDKVIGGWDYADSPTVSTSTDTPGDGPEDNDGHGSHTASTTAGNIVSATVRGYTSTIVLYEELISGVAPHANIIAYDVCGSPNCGQAARISAIDQAILDGVDVINESIGIGGDAFTGPIQAAYLAAYDAGIFVARSAGNDGPDAQTVGPEPVWVTAVAATTHDRNVAIEINLENMSGGNTAAPADITGRSITDGYGPAPIVYAGNFPNANDPTGDPAQCLQPYPAGTFTNQIVVCDRGGIDRVAKSANVAAGGAPGMVLANLQGGSSNVVADRHPIPAVHMDADDGDILRTWLASGTGHTATIGDNFVTITSDPDVMADFSSRGPGVTGLDVIRPDVGAPGVNILAAVQTINPADPPEFEFYNGTSMASPHVAGSAALLKALYPSWSPMQIRSALMTTGITDLVKEDGSTPTDPFDLGGGRVDLNLAQMVGLVLDETASNFEDANPALDGDPKTLNIPSMQNSQCVGGCSWQRTVQSVASITTTWTATVEGITGTVTPGSFELGPGASDTFTVEVDVSDAAEGDFAFGYVVLSPDHGGVVTQHMPIAVVPTGSNLPELFEIEARRNAGSQLIENLLAQPVASPTYETAGFFETDQVETTLGQDNDTGAGFPQIFFDDPSTTFAYSVTVPANAHSLHFEILATDSPDLDMLVVLDGDNDGPEAGEEVCQSASGGSFEFCDIFEPDAGTYYALVINFESEYPGSLDAITLGATVVESSGGSSLMVDGPASIVQDTPFDLTVKWDLPMAEANDLYYGAVTVKDGSESLGTTVVRLDRLADDVTKVASLTEAKAGDLIDFTVEIKSNTLRNDLNYALTDTLPAGLTLMPGTVTVTEGTVNVTGGDTITWQASQQSPFGAEGSYVATTSATDPNCIQPIGAIYQDLQAVHGFTPLSGLSGDGISWTFTNWSHAIYEESPVNPGFNDDGFVIFGSGTTLPFVNDPIPDGSPPDGIAAPYWRDMEIIFDAGTNKGVTAVSYGSGVYRIAEFDDIQVFGDPGQTLDFQIGLWDTPDPTSGSYDLFFAYDNVNVSTMTATVGIENYAGTAGTQYAFNDFIPTDNLLICLDYVLEFESIFLTYSAMVDGGATTGTVYTNTVSSGVDNPDSQVDEADAVITVVDEGSAELQVVHLAPFDAGDAAVDVYLNGSAVLTDFVYSEASGYITGLQAGLYDVEVKLAGTMTTAITADDVPIMPETMYTAAAVGGANGQTLEIMLLDDGSTMAPTLPANTGLVRIGHLAPFASSLADTAVNIINDDTGTPLVENVVYGQTTPFLSLPAGDYDLSIELVDNTPLMDLFPFTLADGDVISAYAGGDGVNQVPNVYVSTGSAGMMPPLRIWKQYMPLFAKN